MEDDVREEILALWKAHNELKENMTKTVGIINRAVRLLEDFDKLEGRVKDIETALEES